MEGYLPFDLGDPVPPNSKNPLEEAPGLPEGITAKHPPWLASRPYLSRRRATSAEPWSTATWRALLKIKGTNRQSDSEPMDPEDTAVLTPGSKLKTRMDLINFRNYV